MKEKKLIIVGDSAFAEIAYEYFTHDSDYKVVAFSVERKFLKKESIFNLPVVPFETLEDSFSPNDHYIFVAIVYTELNRLRARLCVESKRKEFKLASYVSSKAFVWPNVTIGEHCFIFEDNTIQPFVTIGNNIILWSGNHIGHHSEIHDNCFISSHVVISGFCEIRKNCFLGVNATISNNIVIAEDCWIGPGIIITKNTDKASFYKPDKVEPSKTSTHRFFKILSE